MASTRLHSHSSLPVPVVHAVSQSKSHVLAGVQDAYWSDEEADDAECPLCLEEMDISGLNFKPCICGYQVCRFCWHHIKENLNRRCPACRREYTDDAVQFKPLAKEDHKRLTQQKKQRERERKASSRQCTRCTTQCSLCHWNRSAIRQGRTHTDVTLS